MRKIICLLIVLALCISMVCSVSAKGFTPSVTYKGKPEIVPTEDDKGKPVIGVVRDRKPGGKPGDKHDDHDVKSYVQDPCLVITPVAEAETSKEIPKEASDTLRYVYEELSSGRMKLPYEKVEGYNGEKMVIRELFDATWLCGTEESDHDHPTEVAPEGVVFEITLDLGVGPKDTVIVMTYNDGEWEPIVEVENNGDGTVRCVFEHLCPMAISVIQAEFDPVVEETAPNYWWLLLLLLCVFVLILVYIRKRSKR